MTKKHLIGVCVFLLALTAGSVSAEEIVHFTNGTTMAIRSHNVVEGMVHVDLGSNSLMAFPEYMVERIEVAGQDVYLSPSYQRANVTTGRVGGGAEIQVNTSAGSNVYPQTGSTSVSSRYRSTASKKLNNDAPAARPVIGTDPGGTAISFPQSGNRNAKARQLGATGQLLHHSRGVVQGGPSTHTGSQQFGRGHVIGSVTPPSSGKSRANVTVGRLTMRDGTGVKAGATGSAEGSQQSGSSDEGQN